MIHIIAYDIANGKRLGKIAKLCEDYGVRIEKSVFEMDLPKDLFDEFWRKMANTVDDNYDSVVDYPVLSNAIIGTLGIARRPLASGCLVF